jgi:hypothetical protein
VNELYLNLIQQGWKLHEIDQMDMVFYMRLYAHVAKKQQKEEKVYIDQILF